MSDPPVPFIVDVSLLLEQSAALRKNFEAENAALRERLAALEEALRELEQKWVGYPVLSTYERCADELAALRARLTQRELKA